MKTTVRTFAAAIALAALAEPAGAWWKKDCRLVPSYEGQTSMVADINPGPADAVSTEFGFTQRDELLVNYQGKLYFQANDGKSGAELWRINDDGTPSQVEDFVPGAGSSSPHHFVQFQNKLYFAATTPATGEELFSYDGTSIALAAEAVAGPQEKTGIKALTEYKGALYFTRISLSQRSLFEVWRLSGGTVEPVAAINANPGFVGGATDAIKSPFVVFGGRLYYVMQTPKPEHIELWAYDGSTAQKIKGLTPGDAWWTYEVCLFVFKGALYFGVVAESPKDEFKAELWKYSGKGAPVKVATLPDFMAPPQEFQSYKGKLYFSGFGIGIASLYRLEGSVVQELTSLPRSPRNLSLLSKADRLFFGGYYGPGDLTIEPYIFDGSTATLVKNIMPDTNSPTGSHPTSAVEVSDSFFFFAEDQDHGEELWRVSGPPMQVLECDAVAAPIFVNELLWVVKDPEVVVATWLIDPERAPRLLSREVVRVDRGKEIRVRVLRRDTRRQPLPEAFAFATISFNRATGEPLDRGFETVGDPSPRAAQAIRRAAARVLAKPMKEVMAEPLQR